MEPVPGYLIADMIGISFCFLNQIHERNSVNRQNARSGIGRICLGGGIDEISILDEPKRKGEIAGFVPEGSRQHVIGVTIGKQIHKFGQEKVKFPVICGVDYL